MQQFLGDPDSGMLNLEAHRLALAIAKKTLDENCFGTVQKTMDRQPSSFQIGDRVYFKNKQTQQVGPQVETRIVLIECDEHFLHIENQATRKSMILQHEGCSFQTSCRILEHRYPIWQNWKNMLITLQTYLYKST